MWDVEEIDIDLICDLVQLALSMFGYPFLVQTASEVLQSVLLQNTNLVLKSQSWRASRHRAALASMATMSLSGWDFIVQEKPHHESDPLNNGSADGTYSLFKERPSLLFESYADIFSWQRISFQGGGETLFRICLKPWVWVILQQSDKPSWRADKRPIDTRTSRRGRGCHLLLPDALRNPGFFFFALAKWLSGMRASHHFFPSSSLFHLPLQHAWWLPLIGRIYLCLPKRPLALVAWRGGSLTNKFYLPLLWRLWSLFAAALEFSVPVCACVCRQEERKTLNWAIKVLQIGHLEARWSQMVVLIVQ